MQEILDNAQIFNGVDSSSQCDDSKAFPRPPWRTDTVDKYSLKPQSNLMVTHVNQTLALQKAKKFSATPNKTQTSEEWLMNHDLTYQEITLKDLLIKGKQVKKAGEGKHLVFDATVITEMEYKLNMAIEQYHMRVKWLLEGSKKLFGLVKGERVGVLIDSSDANTGFGRLQDFQQSLLYLMDEQLKYKKSLYLLSFGSEPESLWNHARDLNLRTLEEARDFIRGLHPAGGCNLLKSFKKVLQVKKLNSLLIILGNCPDQTSSVLFDYIQQCLLGRNLPVHAVAYDTSNHLTHDTLKKLAQHSNGRYHCYNSSDDREVYKSFDIQLLLREAQRAVDVISKIKQMRTGMLGDALISIENEISLEVGRLSNARLLPRPPNHHRPLSIETPNFHPQPSVAWLAESGLRANNLNLYQILAPNAFDPVQDFVPILRKPVGSKVHGCRFGSHPKMWKPHMVKPSPENLQAAWNWVQNLEASGGRNVMSAFRTAIENGEDIKMFGGPQAIYVISSGVPDQEEDVLCSFVSECTIGSELKVHTILFSIDDYSLSDSELPSRYATMPQTAGYLRNFAHAGSGRFHWFRETGVVESDDIIAITREMDRAVHYSQRCSLLVESVKARDDLRREQSALKQSRLMICNGDFNRKKKTEMVKQIEFIEPRPTALTLARMNRQEAETTKALAWKVSNRNASLPPTPYKSQSTDEETSSNRPQSSKKSRRPQKETFYTEDKNSVGVVYKKYPKKKSVRKAVPEPIFPQMEERITSKQWLRKYGIKKMKLDLNRYVSGPVCIHKKARSKNVTSKWFCSIFPSVDIDGQVRHIDMQESEMVEYEKHVVTLIRRYLTRMQWLLSGSRKMFGSILESNVVILIDVSGSMSYNMDELKKEITSLIWEQLNGNKTAFNIVAFSNTSTKWQDSITESNQSACHDAVQWVSALTAHGGSATLKAIQVALADEEAEAIYLLTDGKPDSSIKLTLSEASNLNKKNIPIHTISFNCDNREANDFLKSLSSNSGGRFHRCHGEADAQFAIHRLMQDECFDEDDPNLPSFQGDDLKRLNDEVNKARKFLTQSRRFKSIIQEHEAETRKEQEPPSPLPNKWISDKPFLP
nr:von Willebrand factor A domain-containing protein 3A [Ciona intestinalis]|eukprot:XP_018668721.1 von Willebrand factor A domain-containing protein 3A [Ciona intestinalis]